MDIFAHALWTNIVYRKKYLTDVKSRLWAVLFGVLPDLVSFTPATLFAFSHFGNRQYLMELASSNMWVFAWARESYNYTHSLVVFIVAVVIVTALRKGKVWWPMFGWLLHIVIDIFTHPDFYQTPLFYPLSNFRNHYAISWADSNFMFINYGLLAIFYIFIFYFAKKRKHNKT